MRVANAGGRLRAGLFVRGAIVGPARTAITLPRSALLPGDGGAASEVAIVDGDGVIGHRSIVARDGDGGEVVEVVSGLSPGVRVVVAGGYALADGQHVRIVP